METQKLKLTLAQLRGQYRMVSSGNSIFIMVGRFFIVTDLALIYCSWAIMF